MDRPADPTIAFSVGNSATNDDGGPASKDPNESPITGKKRSPSNSISKGSGRAKKRSPLKNCVENGEYYVGEETNMANSEDVVDSVRSSCPHSSFEKNLKPFCFIVRLFRTGIPLNT